LLTPDDVFGKPHEAARGRLLIANPFLQDPSFKRSVVLLTEHSADGSVGFILNHPVDIQLNDAARDFPALASTLHYGGPVELDSLHFLHRLGDVLEGAIEVCEGVFWGGHVAMLKALIRRGGVQPNDIRFFVGYSGWSPGQLHEELTQKSWIVADTDAEIVFENNPDKLWQRVLRSMGQAHVMISNFPEDPSLN